MIRTRIHTDDDKDRIRARIVYSEQGNIAAVAWRGGVVSYYCPREDVRVVKRRKEKDEK